MPGKIVQSSGGGGAAELTGFPLALGVAASRQEAGGSWRLRVPFLHPGQGRSRGRVSQTLREDVEADEAEGDARRHAPAPADRSEGLRRGPAAAPPAGTAGDGGYVPVHGALLVQRLPSRLRRDFCCLGQVHAVRRAPLSRKHGGRARGIVAGSHFWPLCRLQR